MKLHLHLDNGIVCGEGLPPVPGPGLMFAINDHITPDQHALSELNEFNDHNELNDHIELNDHSYLALNDHIDYTRVQRVNMF